MKRIKMKKLTIKIDKKWKLSEKGGNDAFTPIKFYRPTILKIFLGGDYFILLYNLIFN